MFSWMLPWLIYRDQLHGSESKQQVSLTLHRAFTWSRLNIWTSIGATCKSRLIPKWCWGQISQGKVTAHCGNYFWQWWSACSPRLGCLIPQGSHVWSDTPRLYAKLFSPGLRKKHDAAAAAADHHIRWKDLIQQLQTEWFSCTSAQSWIEKQKRNAFTWMKSVER